MRGKKVIVAVTGSIAAYKAAFLVRALIREGIEVQVIMTEAAKAFVSPLTFSTLSKRPVLSEMFSDDQWNNHVELGLWADAMLIAPATANTLSKCATGQADNLVVATYLSAKCPVYFAPAMDLDMWAHGSTKENMDKLTVRGGHVIPVGHGELASGLYGDGRLAEPEEIVEFLKGEFEAENAFTGKHVMVTAGPTHEAIDPVRYIGNPSTGKMGIEIANAFMRRGAKVSLILGPVNAEIPSGIEVTRVVSAQEMHDAAVSIFPECDVAILAAAVSDYKPVHASATKIKKGEGPVTMELERTPDIAYEVGEKKRKEQVIVGFALETDNAEANATEKLEKKNFNFIVLNSLEDAGAGFGYDTNKVKFIYPGNQIREFELKPKAAVARDICQAVAEILH